MRTSRRGLIVALGLLGVCLAWWFYSPRLFPQDAESPDFIIIRWVLIAPCANVAFATFCGCVVCAGRALYQETFSRTMGGYTILAASTLSAIALLVLLVHSGFIL